MPCIALDRFQQHDDVGPVRERQVAQSVRRRQQQQISDRFPVQLKRDVGRTVQDGQDSVDVGRSRHLAPSRQDQRSIVEQQDRRQAECLPVVLELGEHASLYRHLALPDSYADDMEPGLASVIVRDQLHVGSDHVVELWRRSDAAAMARDEGAYVARYCQNARS